MWRRWGTPQNFLLAFLDELWKTWKIRILKKRKKIAGDIIILHMCAKNHNHMRYSSWNTEWAKIFCHFGPFFALYPPHPPILPNNLEDQNFEKMKSIWSCHHFKLVQQKTHSNGVCLQRYEVVWQTQFFVILGHFLLFYPTIDPKN